MFSHALSFYKYTQVNTMMYDLRCNAGGARPVKVRTSPASITSYIVHHCVYLCIYSSIIMRLRSSPGGVKVSKLLGKPEVSGSFPESGLRFLYIMVVFTLYLPLFRLYTLKRGALFQALCLIPQK